MGCAEEPEEALCWLAAESEAPEGCCSEGSMVHCGVSACATPACVPAAAAGAAAAWPGCATVAAMGMDEISAPWSLL